MKTLIAVVMLMGFCMAHETKAQSQPTGLALAATWDHDFRVVKIKYARLVLSDSDALTYEMCVEDGPTGWHPPTQPKNIKECNMLINKVEKIENKTPKW